MDLVVDAQPRETDKLVIYQVAELARRGPVVPFRGSRLFQRISLTADRESTVILGETLLPGRVAHGEAHVYNLYRSETEVCRSDGVLLFSDVLRLGPADDRHPTSIGLLGGYDVVATLYVVSGRTDPIAMVAGLRAALESCPDFAGRRQRTAQRLRCRRQTAWLHLEGSADGAGHGVERGTPGAARDSGAHPAQGIARSAVRTPPPPPIRSHLADVGRDHARLSWRSWKARRHNGPHNAPVMKRSSSTTAIDDDEVSPREQLLLDRKELHELGLTLDNPEGFADD